MNKRNLYPAPEFVDIGELKDNDPPVYESVDEYLIPNAYINANGYIFKGLNSIKETVSFRHRDSVTFKNVLSNYLIKKKIKIDQPAISIMSGWNDNFYHFTLESLPKLYVLRKHIDSATIVFPQDLKQFHKEWIEILNLKNITYLTRDEILKTPLAISSTFTSRDLNHHNLIIPEFREWALKHIENTSPIEDKNIFVGRKSPSKRNILNIEQVKQAVESRGFRYVEMEDYNLTEQINIFRNAEKIIAIHGAALSHLCFSNPATKVLDLIHNDYKVYCFLKLSKIMNINYSLLFCEGEEVEKRLPGYQNISVDVKELDEIIDSW